MLCISLSTHHFSRIARPLELQQQQQFQVRYLLQCVFSVQQQQIQAKSIGFHRNQIGRSYERPSGLAIIRR